jgi:hypothetical protein
MLFARVGTLSVPWASLFAPAVCWVCHGCPVAHEHDTCDCEACNAVADGSADDGALLRAPAHGSAAPDGLAADAPFLMPPPLRFPVMVGVPRELSFAWPALDDRLCERPPTPPPRALSRQTAWNYRSLGASCARRQRRMPGSVWPLGRAFVVATPRVDREDHCRTTFRSGLGRRAPARSVQADRWMDFGWRQRHAPEHPRMPIAIRIQLAWCGAFHVRYGISSNPLLLHHTMALHQPH